MLTKEQYEKLKPFELALRMYVETNTNVGMDLRKLQTIYKEIDPSERIDLWCSGCTDIMIRKSYDLLKEYENGRR